MIHAERIKQARLLKGLTRAEIAGAVGVSSVAITHFELGRRLPAPPVVFALAIATGVAPEFLERTPPPMVSQGSLAYRARASATNRERDRALQYLALLVEQLRGMSARLNLPPLRFPKPQSDPLQSARMTRVALGVKRNQPVPYVINLIEKHGGAVLSLPLHLEGIDAFSTWAEIDVPRPIIALSSVAAGDRIRFSTAHELGHLVMHRGVRDYPADLEKEADLFAAEFLFPEEALLALLSKPLTLESAMVLKMQWKVSVQMIIRRARDAGAIPERRYRQLFQQIGARGWRTSEPVEISVERPRLYRQAAETLYGEEYVSRVGREYGIGETLARVLLMQYDASYNQPAPCSSG